MPRQWTVESRTWVFLACLLSAVPLFAQTTQPAAPGAGGGELMQDKSRMIGYGEEVSRQVNEKDEIISHLRNGMVVIVKRIASPAVAVRGYCLTGGVYEGKWLGGGLSHLLEHLVAGGSNERRTEAENKNLLQRIGNDSNAYTTDDHTAYFVNTTAPHMEEAVDLVTGWMLGAQITVPEYRREYQVVQRELERGKGMPDQVFWNLFLINRFHVAPSRVPTIGYQEVIQGLSRDDVYSYYQLAYQPNNMVFVVVADIDPETMLTAVRKNVANSKPGRAFSHDIAAEPPVVAPRTMVATFPNLGPARADLAFPSVREDNPEMYALDLLGTIVGGGESSILVQDLRDKRQLVSGVACEDWTPSFVDGSFMIDYSCDPDKVQAASSAILEDLAAIREQGVSSDQLQRAKTDMRMARLRQMQTSQDVAASLATDFFETGDAHFSDHYVQRIAALTADQVQAAAKKYLDPGKLVTTVLLPAEAAGAGGLSSAEDLLRPPAKESSGGSGKAGEPAALSQFTLGNGTILLTRQFTTTPLISARMYALGGVTAEDAENNGLGNLAMDMLARGTATRSAADIAEYFDSIGGGLQATCGNNTWLWSMSCAKDDFARALAVYADVVLHPAFSDQELGQMKRRVVAGITAQDAEWHDRAFRFFKKEFYSPLNSPYQFMPVGTIDNVKKFSAAQVRDWYEKKVLTAPRVLAIYGDVTPDQARQLAESLLGGGEKIPPPSAPEFAAAPAGAPAAARLL